MYEDYKKLDGVFNDPLDIIRFRRNFIVTTADACWEWCGSTGGKNYGQFYIKGRTYRAHRLAYYLFYKINPGDLMILHSCNTTKCVNPHHLRIGTNSDNMIQKVEDGNHFNANKTHCINGHKFTEENTIIKYSKEGRIGRDCRECNRERSREAMREYRRRKRGY